MVDSRYLNLEVLIAENGQNTVWAATYVEPETGVVHQTAVKKFPSSPSEDQLNQIHKELSVLFMASNRCNLLQTRGYLIQRIRTTACLHP